MGEVVVEVSELHDARESSRRPRRCRDAAHVDLVWLTCNVGQELQGLHLNKREALVWQPPARVGTELEQVVEQCRGLRVCRDSGRDPRKMLDDRIAEAVALAFVGLTGNAVSDCGVHSPSFHRQLHSDVLASPKLLTALATAAALLAIAAIWAAEGLAGSAATAL